MKRTTEITFETEGREEMTERESHARDQKEKKDACQIQSRIFAANCSGLNPRPGPFLFA
jgi:hypothetical protein